MQYKRLVWYEIVDGPDEQTIKSTCESDETDTLLLFKTQQGARLVYLYVDEIIDCHEDQLSGRYCIEFYVRTSKDRAIILYNPIEKSGDVYVNESATRRFKFTH